MAEVTTLNILSETELEKGGSLCRENAQRYFGDAKILYEKGSYGHAFMLGTFCIEEIGKCFLLLNMKDGFIPQTQYWQNVTFRDHTHKILFATMCLLGLRDLPKSLSSTEAKKRSLEWALKLERFRQWSQYVDHASGWRSPSSPDFRKLSKDLLLICPIFLSIRPVPKEEHREYIERILSDKRAIQEMDQLATTALPFFRRSLKRHGRSPKLM